MSKLINPNTGKEIILKTTEKKKTVNKINSLKCNKEWAKLTVKKRIHYLEIFKNLLLKNKVILANVLSTEIGKPLWESLNEISASINKIDTTVTAMEYRLTYPQKKHTQTYIKPIGLVGVIGPFNFPIHIPNGQIIPALITGNRVIVKPSEYAFKTSKFIEKLWKETFKNIVSPIEFCYGRKDIGELIVDNINVNAIFFTGSTKTGKKIEKKCLNTNKLCVLEMGGNNALIVEDTFNALISNIISSSLITSGQRCSCAQRIIINKNFSHIIPKLVNEIKKIKINPFPSDKPTFMGPIVLNHVKTELLNKNYQNSETLLKSINLGPGGLISPRVELTNAIYDQEIFGPIIFISIAKNLEEAIQMANKTKYGLTSSIYTKSKKKFSYALNNINTGVINWNTPTTGASGFAPFGGIKESGNYRPAGFNMIDHCVIPVASTQKNMPDQLNLEGLS